MNLKASKGGYKKGKNLNPNDYIHCYVIGYLGYSLLHSVWTKKSVVSDFWGGEVTDHQHIFTPERSSQNAGSRIGKEWYTEWAIQIVDRWSGTVPVQYRSKNASMDRLKAVSKYRGHGECGVVLPGCCSEREWCELRHNCIRQDNCVESECYDGTQNVLWRNKKWLSSEQNAWRHAKRRLCTAFSRIEKRYDPDVIRTRSLLISKHWYRAGVRRATVAPRSQPLLRTIILSGDQITCLGLYWRFDDGIRYQAKRGGRVVRMAERSKALRSGRSLVLQAWVRIPLLTNSF